MDGEGVAHRFGVGMYLKDVPDLLLCVCSRCPIWSQEDFTGSLHHGSCIPELALSFNITCVPKLTYAVSTAA